MIRDMYRQGMSIRAIARARAGPQDSWQDHPGGAVGSRRQASTPPPEERGETGALRRGCDAADRRRGVEYPDTAGRVEGQRLSRGADPAHLVRSTVSDLAVRDRTRSPGPGGLDPFGVYPAGWPPTAAVCVRDEAGLCADDVPGIHDQHRGDHLAALPPTRFRILRRRPSGDSA